MNPFSKLRFLEFGRNAKGQHFISVLYWSNGEQILIGRIHREYNNETRKVEYWARDAKDMPIFVVAKDLEAIKRKFRQYGRDLAEPDRIPGEYTLNKQIERENKLKAIRDKNNIQAKKQEVSKPVSPTSEVKPEEVQTSEKSAREKELESLRDKGNDNEREYEIEM
ncbi:MAG: hypothetical protein WC223_01430 [Bacteroidales bacterium]|jgi:hypothetical protein